MDYRLKHSISLKDICTNVNIDVLGMDILVEGVCSNDSLKSRYITFSKSLINENLDMVVIVPQKLDIPENSNSVYLKSSNPRLDFMKILDFLNNELGFAHFDFESEIHSSVYIGKNVVIHSGCKIAENVILEDNVVIHKGTTIGKNTRIRANSSIGGDGFGFERLEDNTPLRFVHLGGVQIGANVEIGSNSCIARGTMSNTIIKNNVKIDNLIHIAHNCTIEDGAMLIACCEISGGVKIGKNAWIGPNASLMQKITIGDNSFIGLGSVVLKSVPANMVYAGNPARFIKEV